LVNVSELWALGCSPVSLTVIYAFDHPTVMWLFVKAQKLVNY